MERWRLLFDDDVSAADGLATDEALMARYARTEPDRPPTVRLYTYASHSALVGRYQTLEAEVDLDACARTGTDVGRRPTGGGAIVMGAGQLGVAVTARAPASERPKETIERLSTAIAAGLAEVGIETGFRGKNDLEVGGRKIAGLGLYLDDRGAMLFHSSVLADLDVAFMLEVLRIPAAKLGDKAVAAVCERVTTVSRETGETWTGARLREVVGLGFEKAFGVELQPGEPDTAETELAAGLAHSKYRDESWLRQRSPHADALGTATFKTPGGLVRVYLALDGGAIKSALFAGDFNELPPELVRLESALRWTRVERAHGVVVREAGRGVLGAEADVVSAAVAEAAERAASRTVAAPDREGSCYFPEVE